MKKAKNFPERIISTYRCPECKSLLDLTSYAEATKWETVIHGIKCYCPECKYLAILTEKEA